MIIKVLDIRGTVSLEVSNFGFATVLQPVPGMFLHGFGHVGHTDRLPKRAKVTPQNQVEYTAKISGRKRSSYYCNLLHTVIVL